MRNAENWHENPVPRDKAGALMKATGVGFRLTRTPQISTAGITSPVFLLIGAYSVLSGNHSN